VQTPPHAPPPAYSCVTSPSLSTDGSHLVAPTHVVLADDSVLLRDEIARLLEDAGFAVVDQRGTADDLMLKVRSYEPDVAIIDIRMPPTQTDEGLQPAKQICVTHPETAVVVFTNYIEAGYALELLQDNAEGVGYLLKDRVSDLAEFAAAVKRVAEGGTALDPSVVSQLLGRSRRHDPLAALTPREREVLALMAKGLFDLAIAERIVVTERSVEKNRSCKPQPPDHSPPLNRRQEP
jgi:DNA-binding NarL/FixJ family response regulator